MAPPFKKLTRDQFTQLVEVFDFRRRIDAVHMHHTWKPSRAQFRGHDTIVSMWRFHTETNGWSDIAQHITIDPQGEIWLGRSWNQPPASAGGFNGNARVGPFMFEMIGNFDHGQDPFALDSAQEKTVIEVIAAIQKRFDLAPETLRFHNMMSSKSCPGSAIRYGDIVNAVRDRRRQLDQEAPRQLPFGPEAREIDPAVQDALRALTVEGARAVEPADAEPEHNEFLEAPEAMGARGAMGARAPALSAESLEALRPHLVNLTQGEFSEQGEFKTSREDVDAIFEEHLPRALAELEQRGESRRDRLRLLFYAHGGLVKESEGLRMALDHVEWWKDNGIYPIYFVWETGLLETFGQLLRRAQERGRRGLARDIGDVLTDPLIEQTLRALHGPRVWGGMKRSAELAVTPPRGGARYVIERLEQFCRDHPNRLELHAVGHSAGAIFQAHVLATARTLGLPSFKTAHFMAPAIRVNTFKELLLDKLGQDRGVDYLTIFALRKSLELADQCVHIYRKSILYLVRNAGEPEPGTPLLGLEIDLRRDSELKTLFGLGPRPSPLGEVIWSISTLRTGRSASQSTTHGGFDNDGPTMSSIARRVLDKADADPIVDFPQQLGRGGDIWEDQVDWPEPLAAVAAPQPALAAPPVPVAPPGPAGSPFRAPPAGRRRALCIGIDRYPSAPLAGCVADANTWVQTLLQLGFERPVLLTNEQATRSAIIDNIHALLAASAAGDVLVFQFAGHGTRFPDVDGDEQSGRDQAIVPYDFETGAYLIDDDVAELFTALPEGVNLTCFMDCCHSGTNTRFAVGAPPGAMPDRDERQRVLPATEEMIQQHKAFRQTLPGRRALTRAPHRVINFAACQPDQVAWESSGQGEFTVQATRLLRSGVGGLTNRAFEQRVIAAFGSAPRQKPLLDCPDDAESRLLLAPLGGGGALPAVPAGAVPAPAADVKDRIVAALQTAIQALQRL